MLDQRHDLTHGAILALANLQLEPRYCTAADKTRADQSAPGTWVVITDIDRAIWVYFDLSYKRAQASWTGLQPFLRDSSTASTTLLVMAASLGHHSSGLAPALMALMHFPKASHINVSCGLSRYTCTP